MASSPPRRSRRDDVQNNGQRSRSQSSDSSGYSAPTYRVEENSEGELVNKRIGVTWPERVYYTKRYPNHDSSSPYSSEEEDQFKTSPYEMISIAELDAAVAAGAAGGEKRAVGGRRSREIAASPPYASLSSRSDEEYSSAERDESTTKIDSVVFDTAEELERYQTLFRKASAARSANSVTSTISIADSTTRKEREETNRHFLGVRSRRTVDKKLRPGQFFMYYDKPSGGEIPVMVELKIGYMSSTNKIYHFPIQRFQCEGEQFYAVRQTDMDVKMFPSIASLVQHYHTFSHVDFEASAEVAGLSV